MSTYADVVTLNDDFTDMTTDLPTVLAHNYRTGRRPMAVLLQEGKRTRYRRVLRRLRRRLGTESRKRRLEEVSGYRVFQLTGTEAQRGLAIAVDTEQVRVLSGPYYQELVEPRGAAMLPRGVLWVVAEVRATGQKIVLATTHRPPRRYSWLWTAYDVALASWVEGREHPVILGLDANTERLQALADALGLKAAGVGIDGVMVGRDLRVWGAKRLRRHTSDHAPVRATITFP